MVKADLIDNLVVYHRGSKVSAVDSVVTDITLLVVALKEGNKNWLFGGSGINNCRPCLVTAVSLHLLTNVLEKFTSGNIHGWLLGAV